MKEVDGEGACSDFCDASNRAVISILALADSMRASLEKFREHKLSSVKFEEYNSEFVFISYEDEVSSWYQLYFDEMNARKLPNRYNLDHVKTEAFLDEIAQDYNKFSQLDLQDSFLSDYQKTRKLMNEAQEYTNLLK